MALLLIRNKPLLYTLKNIPEIKLNSQQHIHPFLKYSTKHNTLYYGVCSMTVALKMGSSSKNQVLSLIA